MGKMGKMGLLTFIKNLRLKNDQENNYNLFKASCLGTLLKVVVLFKTIKTFPCNFFLQSLWLLSSIKCFVLFVPKVC